MTAVPEPVRAFLEGVKPEKRQRDASTLVDLMTKVTGESPQLQGTIVGFGQYHYRYDSGREGDAPAASFAPRNAATTVYLPDGVDRYAEQLGRLGPHKTGVSCLYLADLEQVDLDVLEDIVSQSYRTVTQGGYLLATQERQA